MKKKSGLILISIILIIGIIFAIISIFNSNSKVSFNATIIKVSDNSILVTPDEGSSELNSADLISVSIREKTKIVDENKNELDKDSLKVNQKVVIYYDGLIAESYPAQIINCNKIKVLL
jgi:Protein of unknown function (DUF3221)